MVVILGLVVLDNILGDHNAVPGSKQAGATVQSQPSSTTDKVGLVKKNLAAKQAPSRKRDETLDASDHCSMVYVGSTTEQAFEQVTPAVRGQVVDCISYYLEHKRYPTAGELEAYTAQQQRDYERQLSPQERRRRTEEAIGKVICQGNESCVERGVAANQAIDKLEDQLNADERN